MKIIFAAGGTAGHINPALAIADKIKAIISDSEILFIGTPNSLEEKLVQKAGYNFHAIEMAGIQRSLSFSNIKRNVKALYWYSTAKVKAKSIIKTFAPDLVIGTGGYVTAPVLGVAAKMGIKTATHESNSLPGITTKMLAKKVNRVYLANEDAKKRLPDGGNYVITGNPLRSDIPFKSKEDARKELGLKDGFTILSFGGSQGANRINKAIAYLIAWEKGKEINHIHAYGKLGKEVFSEYLTQANANPDESRADIREYIHNMYTCLCASDLIISRAGAMTLTELCAVGRASILVPYPNAAENHQYYNAKSLEKQDAAIVIEDKLLSPQMLINKVEKLIANPEKVNEMGKNAKNSAVLNSAELIASDLLQLVEGGK